MYPTQIYLQSRVPEAAALMDAYRFGLHAFLCKAAADPPGCLAKEDGENNGRQEAFDRFGLEVRPLAESLIGLFPLSDSNSASKKTS